MCYITARRTDELFLFIGYILLQTHTQFKISLLAVAENITHFKILCLPTICNHTQICNLQRVGHYFKRWMYPFWFVASEWLPVSLLWENLLCFPLYSLLLFCLSLHPFQFLPEVCRCYNEWLFLSSFPDRAITWRLKHWGIPGKSTVFSAEQTQSLIFNVGVRSWSKTWSACITGLYR